MDYLTKLLDCYVPVDLEPLLNALASTYDTERRLQLYVPSFAPNHNNQHNISTENTNIRHTRTTRLSDIDKRNKNIKSTKKHKRTHSNKKLIVVPMPQTAKKRSCKFTEDLQKEFPFLQKCLTPSEVR
ncbi:hypothetical protein WA026_021517 [Henosepilachna vigintioctopunctata]|uniref:Uncharacterized protein n=1 Tax=Henosepilachna vigintioctopunctata TaxID=420089 RepID=A0AAW1VJA4_9CUCU